MVGLIAFALLPSGRTARALPPAGTDNVWLSGQVSIVSRIGQETVQLTGTATIDRSNPQLQGGVEVVDTEIVAMSLTGQSVTGPVSVAESPTLASTGRIQSKQPPPDQFPASSFFDVLVQVTVPASPGGSVVLHNDVPLRLAPTGNIARWPPVGVAYVAAPDPCVPLIPTQPKNICITSASFTFTQAVGGETELADRSASATNEREDADGFSGDLPGIGVAAGLGASALAAAALARRRLLSR